MAEADDFTADPDLLESDRTLGRVPLYQTLLDEPGRQKGKATTCALATCPRCGADVILGQTAAGAVVPVELRTQVYTLVWDRGPPWPRLAQSRGYVAHACGG